jgi:predicted RNase H-like HicB family nuclease
MNIARRRREPFVVRKPLLAPSVLIVVKLNVALERTELGTWMAHVVELPQVRAMGEDRLDALRRVQAGVLRVMAAQLEAGHGSRLPTAEVNLAFSID